MLFISVLVFTMVITGSAVANPKNSGRKVLDDCAPLAVAHRGASGYVPEHTLGAYALAITMGADYVEPDLVITKDGHLIARHDSELSATTDVATHPEFASLYKIKFVSGLPAMGWFVEDFTLEEIKTLRCVERFSAARPGNTRMNGIYEIPTLQEIIDLVKSMQISEKRIIGIVPEIKSPTHYQQLGLPMEQAVVDVFNKNGYHDHNDPVLIQSFEVTNLKDLKNLTDIRLVQLYGASITRPYDQIVAGNPLTYGDMATAEGLREVATYAYAVGPDKSYIIPRDASNRLGNATNFVTNAHAAGLKVIPYTFRAENSYLPAEFRSDQTSVDSIGDLSGEIAAFFAAGVDGVFADQPNVPVSVRGRCAVEYALSRATQTVSLSLMLTLSVFMCFV